MSYFCKYCKRKIRKNYPYGTNSKPEETGHKTDCNKKKAIQMELKLKAKRPRKGKT